MNLTEFQCRNPASCLLTNLNEKTLYCDYFVYIDTIVYSTNQSYKIQYTFKPSFYIRIVLKYNMAQSANF